MDLGLRGVPAVVLSSSRGLGLATARALIDEGAAVLLTARNETSLAQVAGEVGAAAHVAGDATDPAFMDQLARAAETLIGGAQVLVVNCGGPPVGIPAEIDDAQWLAGNAMVLMTLARAVRAFRPLLEARPWGRILIVGASGYREPTASLVVSDAYRAASVVLAKVYADELMPKNITVNTVAPGVFNTARLAALSPEVAQHMTLSSPAGRPGEPSEFGALCAFLCSRPAGYITGQTITIDGGTARGV